MTKTALQNLERIDLENQEQNNTIRHFENIFGSKDLLQNVLKSLHKAFFESDVDLTPLDAVFADIPDDTIADLDLDLDDLSQDDGVGDSGDFDGGVQVDNTTTA